MRGNGSQLGVTVPLTARMALISLSVSCWVVCRGCLISPGPGGTEGLMGGVTGHVIRALSGPADECCCAVLHDLL